MLSKGKNNVLAFAWFAVAVSGCGSPAPERDPGIADSLSRATQKKRTDSIKAKNPWQPVPPDSSYTGTYIDRYGNGIVKFRGFYRQGKRHGQWVSFYHTGLPWSEMHYDKGLRHGPNITYFENGEKRYEGQFKMDLRDSVWTYYDTSGTAVKKVTFSDDAIVAQQDLTKR